MKQCKYFEDTARCHYCAVNDPDKSHWRRCHRVVEYWVYRMVVLMALFVGLWVGFWIGVKVS